MKKISVINVLYIVSVVYAIGIFVKIYYDRSKLPAGVCPIDNNNLLIYSSIVLLVVTSIITGVVDYRNKKAEKLKKIDLEKKD